MLKRILTTFVVVLVAGLFMAWGCQSSSLTDMRGEEEVPTDSVPVEIAIGFAAGDSGLDNTVTKDVFDPCNWGVDGEGASGAESVDANCQITPSVTTLPGGFTPIVLREETEPGVWESAADACKDALESPANCLGYYIDKSGANCVIHIDGYVYDNPVMDSQHITLSLQGQYLVNIGSSTDIEVAAVGIMAQPINEGGTQFAELATDFESNVPSPAIDITTDCTGVLNTTDPFDITVDPDPYENMVDAQNLKYRQSFSLDKNNTSCIIIVNHSADISLNGITMAPISFQRDLVKISGFIVQNVFDPMIGLDGLYDADLFAFYDMDDNLLSGGEVIDVSEFTVSTGDPTKVFIGSQIGGTNVQFSSGIAGLKPGLTYSYSEPIDEFTVIISENDVWKLEKAQPTYTINNMVVYDGNLLESYQQDLQLVWTGNTPCGTATEWHKATLDKNEPCVVTPAGYSYAPISQTVADNAWIDGDGDGEATLVHDALNHLYTFTDATLNQPAYEADVFAKQGIDITAPQGYTAGMTLNLTSASGVTDFNINLGSVDTYENRDAVIMSLSDPVLNGNEEAAYWLFTWVEEVSAAPVVMCGAVTMELNVDHLEATSGAYVDCSADSNRIIKLVGSQTGIDIFYNGTALEDVVNAHEYRDWDSDGELTQDLTIHPITAFGSTGLDVNLIIGSEGTTGLMTFDLGGIYISGMQKDGWLPGMPAEAEVGQ